MAFQGFVELGDAFRVQLLVTNSSGTPVNMDALPTFRVYGQSGFVSGQSGSASYTDSGSITDATNASPIVITSANHGLATGDRVTVQNVGGNTGANGSFVITVLSSSTFSLDGSSGSASYTSGGTWNITGLYHASLTCSSANGYEAGDTFSVLFEGAVSSTDYASLESFGVT